MNSFRFLERGIEAEIERQKGIVAAGDAVEQETLHFDPAVGQRSARCARRRRCTTTATSRSPTSSPLVPTEEMLERARAALPELPVGARRRASSPSSGCPTRRRACWPSAASWATSSRTRCVRLATATPRRSPTGRTDELVRAWRRGRPRRVEARARRPSLELVGMVDAKAISQSAAKEVLDVLWTKGGDPAAIVEEQGLAIADSATSSRRSWSGRSPRTRTQSSRSRPASGKAVGAHRSARSCARRRAAPTAKRCSD